MAKQRTLQLYRGTTAQNNSFTGSAGELTIDTDTNELRVHDGSTAGGHIIYTKSDVDTIAGAKADDNAVVHLAGTETVTGTKTFDSTIESDIGNGGCALRFRTTRGTDVIADLVQSYDKTANERVASIRTYNDTTRKIVLGVNGFGGGAPQGVQVICDSNNNVSTACPSSDATNSILTTTGISKSSTGGYVKLGNGIIIQWGRTSEATASSSRTITYPTAFTTAPQNVQVCFNVTSNGYIPRVTTVSTTQFVVASDTFSTSANPTNARIRWIAIGF